MNYTQLGSYVYGSLWWQATCISKVLTFENKYWVGQEALLSFSIRCYEKI